MNKQFLVVGGAGFIGSNIVDALIERGDEVGVLDNLSTGKISNINKKAQFYQADIRDLEKIKPFFKEVDCVFLTAALARVQPSIQDPVTYNDVNVNGALNVLMAARDNNVKRVVYSASSSAYGDHETMPTNETLEARPMSPYGLQKYIGELYCRLFSRLYNLETVSLRYFNVYGKRMVLEGAYAPLLGIFARQKQNNETMTIVGDGEQRRDMTNVFDVVRANILASESVKVGKGEVINIGTGTNYSVNEVAKMYGGAVTHLPPRVEPRVSLADNSRARELLGWQPTVNLLEWIEGYKNELGI